MKRYLILSAVCAFICMNISVAKANPVSENDFGYNVSKKINHDVDFSNILSIIPDAVSAPHGTIEFITISTSKVCNPAVSKKLYLLHCALRFC